MTTRAATIVLFFGTLLGVDGRATAQEQPTDAAARLERARVCWAALDPECAEADLAVLRARLDPLAPEARVEVWRLSAEIALAGERPDEAQRHLLALLELDPRFAPAAWPEPWRKALEAARRAGPDRLPPELAVTLPAESIVKAAIPVEVRAHDPGGIARCELVVLEAAGPGERLRVALLAADGLVFVGQIPRDLVRAPGVVVRVEAVDRAGNVACWPVGDGCSGVGHTIPVTPPPLLKSPPITSRWWFWTAIGAVAVGGAVVLALALDGDDPASESGRVGDLLVVEEFP